ncbi:hypothetical protein JCM8202_001155 [Rhodotorula sphaerocarpa]
MHSPRLHLAALLLALFAATGGVQAQLETTVDDLSGNTVVVSVETNIAGVPILTETLSTVTESSTTSTTTLPTTTTTTGPTTQDLGAPAQVLTPESLCTTEGCPPKPTTYTSNNIIVTWYATTPPTVTPTTWSAGTIQSASAYAASITTQSAYRAQVQSAAALSGAGARYSAFPFASSGEWGIMLGVTVVGGLVGAVALL